MNGAVVLWNKLAWRCIKKNANKKDGLIYMILAFIFIDEQIIHLA